MRGVNTKRRSAFLSQVCYDDLDPETISDTKRIPIDSIGNKPAFEFMKSIGATCPRWFENDKEAGKGGPLLG